MAIKIIPEPDVQVTQSEYDYFLKKFQEAKIINQTLEQYIRDNISYHRAVMFQNQQMRNAYQSQPNQL